MGGLAAFFGAALGAAFGTEPAFPVLVLAGCGFPRPAGAAFFASFFLAMMTGRLVMEVRGGFRCVGKLGMVPAYSLASSVKDCDDAVNGQK